VGAKIGEKTAVAAQQAKEALGDGAITAKIKAKMALDDHVKALDLNVDTVNGDVTVSGKVRSNAERDRAIALARETEGVRRVVDKITVARAR
jgi:hyperosmotically inducible protein